MSVHSRHSDSDLLDAKSGNTPVTLVEKDPHLTTDQKSNFKKNCEVVPYLLPPKRLWINQVLGMFCVKWSKKSNVTEASGRAEDPGKQAMTLLENKVKNHWKDKRNKLEKLYRNGDFNNEIPCLNKLIPRLGVEANVIDWACKIYDIVHNENVTDNLDKQERSRRLWGNLAINYYRISTELDKELNPRLEDLRRELGYEPLDNPWRMGFEANGGGPQWDSGVNYEFLHRHEH